MGSGCLGWHPQNSRKKALKWIALAIASVVVLDWPLDGRLRKQMPGKRRERTDDINV